MNARVYVLLEVVQGKLAEAVRTLRDRPGVITADIVEGPPDIVMVLEARQRRRLAELTVEALNSIEGVTENMQLLPVTTNSDGHCHIPAVRANRKRKKMVSSRIRGEEENILQGGGSCDARLGKRATREEEASEGPMRRQRGGAKDE